MHSRTLLLNQDYSALAIIGWRRALVFVLSGIAEQIELSDETIKDSAHRSYQLPSVIRLNKYIKNKFRPIKFSKRNLIIRDGGICMYCGIELNENIFTYDHVIPRSKWKRPGTPTNWYNIVSCCYKCNKKKGNQTLEQANMRLLKEPTPPNSNIYPFGYIPKAKISAQWKVYLQT